MALKDIVGHAPVDIQLKIFSYIEDYQQLLKWKRVSKCWRDLMSAPSFAPVYHRFVCKTWPKICKQAERRASLTGDPPCYSDIFSLLGKNSIEIKAGRLHEAGKFSVPSDQSHLGYIKISYKDGFLATFGSDKGIESSTIYVYDVSILQISSAEIKGWKVECEGIVKYVSISDGYMAWLAQDPDESAKISIGLQDLITLATRTFSPPVSDLHWEDFALVVNEHGIDAFTNEDKGRSSTVLRIFISPELFCTNGRSIVLSSSFLTHYTIWDIDIDSDHPMIGRSYSLSPEWNSFLYLKWKHNPDWSNMANLSYHLSINERGDVYTVIDGHLGDKGCVWDYDLFLRRYACTRNGEPFRMKNHALVPPTRNPNLNDSTHIVHLANKLSSFSTGGGHNFFSYRPADTRQEREGVQELEGYYDEEKGSLAYVYGPAPDSQVDRILVDRKQVRYEPPSEFCSSPGCPQDYQARERFNSEFEYDLGYLGERTFYKSPIMPNGSCKPSQAKVIPNPSPECVIWEVQSYRQSLKSEGKRSYIRKVRIYGLKPTVLPEKTASETDFYGRNRSDSLTKSDYTEPTSMCEVEIEEKVNRRFTWEGDDQGIVLSHYEPSTLPTDRLHEKSQASYDIVFRLFRYGNAVGGPVAYPVRYIDESS